VVEHSAENSRRWKVVIKFVFFIKIFLGSRTVIILTVDTAVHNLSDTVTVVMIRSGRTKSDYRMTTVLRKAQCHCTTDHLHACATRST